MKAKKTIKIGLIGAGEFGNFAGSVIDILGGFALYGVVDTDEQSAMALAERYNAKVFSDYRDLLKDEEIEIVLINVPNDLHAQITCDALKAGKKVLCEKPLGINRQELDMVGRVLRENKGILLTNYLLPRSSIYKKLAQFIKSGKYGALKFAYIENLATESTIESKWYWDEKKSGGWFLTADIHFYDLICHLLGTKIDLLGAKEYKKGNRTNALYTSLASKEARIDVFHDFESGYERVSFKARFVFERADIDVEGWVPVGMTIRTGSKKQKITESKDREMIYQRLVAENIIDLTRMSYQESIENYKRVCASSELAFTAQKISRKG